MGNLKTTWEDLARLGWRINEVYKIADKARGGTMKGTGDLFLNKGIAADYQWWCYNTTIGSPYMLGRKPSQTKREEVVYSYDNTENTEPYYDTWTETWTNTTSAMVSATNSASITLDASVTIFDVASSGFSITVSTESTTSQSAENSVQLSHTWPLTVGPHEKLTLMRVITTSIDVADYAQDFGLSNDSMIGTKGDKYKGHYYWAMNVNALLDSPRGKWVIQGSSKIVTYAFKIVREGANGRSTIPLPIADDDKTITEGMDKEVMSDKFDKWMRHAVANGDEVQELVAGRE